MYRIMAVERFAIFDGYRRSITYACETFPACGGITAGVMPVSACAAHVPRSNDTQTLICNQWSELDTQRWRSIDHQIKWDEEADMVLPASDRVDCLAGESIILQCYDWRF